MTYLELAETILKAEEGLRLKPYYCSERIPTIGYGEVVGTKGSPLPNITTTKEKALDFLRNRIKTVSEQLPKKFHKAWSNCNDAQKAILISMTYQLGLNGVSAFTKMWKALEIKDWTLAYKEMLDSKWARQTPNRANRHAKQILTGSVDMYYLTNGEFK